MYSAINWTAFCGSRSTPATAVWNMCSNHRKWLASPFIIRFIRERVFALHSCGWRVDCVAVPNQRTNDRIRHQHRIGLRFVQIFAHGKTAAVMRRSIVATAAAVVSIIVIVCAHHTSHCDQTKIEKRRCPAWNEFLPTCGAHKTHSRTERNCYCKSFVPLESNLNLNFDSSQSNPFGYNNLHFKRIERIRIKQGNGKTSKTCCSVSSTTHIYSLSIIASFDVMFFQMVCSRAVYALWLP